MLMSIVWDSIEQLQEGEELFTAITEGITVIAALSVILVLFYLKFRYSKLTKKGFIEFIIGASIFAVHFLFDLLDTLVTKEINGETTTAYQAFDILDATFAFIGLFIMGYAFFKIAQYGMELWEGDV